MIESTLISLKYHQQNYSLPHQMNPISNTTSIPNANETNNKMLNKKNGTNNIRQKIEGVQ